MALTRRRVVDLLADVSGILVLVLVVVMLDQRFRDALPSVTGATSDLAGMSEDVNTVATVVAVGAAQLFRGVALEHMYLAAFATTATLLVVLLMRL